MQSAGMTPPIMPQGPQQPQIIDPRAQYERESRLAEQMLQQASQYQGGGYGEALAMMLNAYNAKKMGSQAESSLSAALEQELQREQDAARAESEAAARQREQEMEDYFRKKQIDQRMQADPSIIREMQAAGIDPRSDEGRRRILEGTNQGPTVNVNTGEQPQQYLYGSDAGLPAGWRIDTQTGQASRIPGGPAEAEQKELAEKERGRQEGQQRAGRTVLRAATRGLEIVPEITPGSGVAGANARKAKSIVPGTAEYNLQLQVDDFLSNVGLDKLQEMRENSPTGGALGQVPVQQQKRLERVLGSFDLAQDPQIIEENLKEINNSYLDIMFGSPEERQRLVEQGEMSPEENEQINQQYRPTQFDRFGRRVEGEQEQEQEQEQSGDPEIDQLLEMYGT